MRLKVNKGKCYDSNKQYRPWHNTVACKNLHVMRRKERKVKRLAAASSRTQDTSGLSHQCSATEPGRQDNHLPSHICTAQVVLNAPGSLGMRIKATGEICYNPSNTMTYPSMLQTSDKHQYV